MPQILKDEVRERIVDAAREEFLTRSYEHSSMRSIALKSHMTVGNLYRYFTSKEELNRFIVGPTLNRINTLIMKLTGNRVSLESSGELSLDPSQLEGMLDSLGDGLVDIYQTNRMEVNILMMRSALNEQLVSWFAEVIAQIISNHSQIPNNDTLKLLSHSYAVSIFEGIKYMLRETDMEPEELKKALKTYMKSYVHMLDAKLLKEGMDG